MVTRLNMQAGGVHHRELFRLNMLTVERDGFGMVII